MRITTPAPCVLEKQRCQEPALDLGLSETEDWVETLAEQSTSQNSKSLKKLKHTQWISPHTEAEIESNFIQLGKGEAKCGLCAVQGVTRRVYTHVQQHFIRVYCSCRHSSVSKDTIRQHRKEKKYTGRHHTMYEVDQRYYSEFCKTAEWRNPPTFERCQPVITDRDVGRPRRDKTIKERLGPQVICKVQIPEPKDKSRVACKVQAPAPAKRKISPCKVQGESQDISSYKIPRRRDPSPTPMQRFQILDYHLGRDLARSESERMGAKIRAAERDLQLLKEQITEYRNLLDSARTDAERQAVDEELEELEYALRSHRQGIKGLRGQEL